MNQLKAGAALNYVSIVLNMVIGLIYTPYMLRMLGQSEYGLYSLASSIIAYLTVLDLGFGNAIVRYTAKFRAEEKEQEQQEMFGMFFILYIGIGFLAIIAGSVLALNVDNLFSAKMSQLEISRTKIMLWLMTFNLAFTFPMSIWGSIMTAYERFVFQRIVNIIRSVLNPIVMIALLVVGYKAVAMVVVTTLFNVVTLLINYWYCKNRLNIRLKFGSFRWNFLKEISIYSFWIFLNAIMDRIYWSTGQFILGVYGGAATIAVFAVAIQLTHMFMMFSTAINSVFLPKVTKMVTKGGSEKDISNLFIRTGRIQYIIMSFILAAFIVFGKAFIYLWAGEGYEDAYGISVLFFIALLPPLIQNLGITILQARNQMKFRSLCYVAIALISLAFSIQGAKYYGSWGCAFATAGALLVGQGLIMNFYYSKYQSINIIRFWWEIIKMSIGPTLLTVSTMMAISAIGINLASPFTFVITALTFSVAYIFVLWICSMNKEEHSLFLIPFKRILEYKHD